MNQSIEHFPSRFNLILELLENTESAVFGIPIRFALSVGPHVP